jgi:hypothetical protein
MSITGEPVQRASGYLNGRRDRESATAFSRPHGISFLPTLPWSDATLHSLISRLAHCCL